MCLDYLTCFAPDFLLHPELPQKQENQNTRQYLDTLRQYINENVRHLAHAPSVQMQDIPLDMINFDNLDEDDPNKYLNSGQNDKYVGAYIIV